MFLHAGTLRLDRLVIANQPDREKRFPVTAYTSGGALMEVRSC
jgi:hypothetical protein